MVPWRAPTPDSRPRFDPSDPRSGRIGYVTYALDQRPLLSECEAGALAEYLRVRAARHVAHDSPYDGSFELCSDEHVTTGSEAERARKPDGGWRRHSPDHVSKG